MRPAYQQKQQVPVGAHRRSISRPLRQDEAVPDIRRFWRFCDFGTASGTRLAQTDYVRTRRLALRSVGQTVRRRDVPARRTARTAGPARFRDTTCRVAWWREMRLVDDDDVSTPRTEPLFRRNIRFLELNDACVRHSTVTDLARLRSGCHVEFLSLARIAANAATPRHQRAHQRRACGTPEHHVGVTLHIRIVSLSHGDDEAPRASLLDTGDDFGVQHVASRAGQFVDEHRPVALPTSAIGPWRALRGEALGEGVGDLLELPARLHGDRIPT